MLTRISLIVAILAGLAVGGLNFVKVKEKITTLQTNLANETARANKLDADLAKTTKQLKDTEATLASTRKTLETRTTERDQAVARGEAETKRADKLAADLSKTTRELGDSRAELAAFKGTDLKPEEIMAMKKNFKELQAALEGSKEENKLVMQKLNQTVAALERYTKPEKPVYLPAQLTGKVIVTDPKWNFVILNVGADQGMLQEGQLLVNRNGKLVAKIIVRSVQKNQSVANIMPGWQLGEVLEGDQIIPAYPAS